MDGADVSGAGRFRSLYWKILLGLTLLIVVLVLAQAGAVLWLISRGEPGRRRRPDAIRRRAPATGCL